jgi:hypothetical protein
MALPLLEAMLPARGLAQSAVPKRLLAFYFPCGIHMQEWIPSTTGSSFAFSKTLSALDATAQGASMKDDVLVVTGLANHSAESSSSLGDHARGTGTFLTVTSLNDNKNFLANGISMDQVAAGTLQAFTRIPSLQVGVNPPRGGSCDFGANPCPYINNISWASASQPLPNETNPQSLFDKLFAADPMGAQTAAAERRRLLKKSVLDSVMADTTRLQTRLGHSDRNKLDEYLGGIRELEKSLDPTATPPPTSSCALGAAPTSGGDLPTRTKQLLDLTSLAFQCDLTRVATFMLMNGGEYQPFPWLGVSGDLHNNSHYSGSAEKLDAYVKMNGWEVEQFAYLCRKLKGMQELGGTVLDHSALFCASEISDGQDHGHQNLPVVLAGKAGGALKTGLHLNIGSRSISDLYLALLHAVGVPASSFGGSSTALSDVLV